MAREQVGRLALLPTELKRPVFGEALEQFWSFSRIAMKSSFQSPTSCQR